MALSYAERLKDPRWQRRRLEILQRSDFTCERCDAVDRTLHVHHKLYRKGAMPWDYADHELEALCESCHSADHKWRTLLDEAALHCDIERLVGYAEGLAALSLGTPLFPAIPVRSCEHALGLADALWEWNGGGAHVQIADCICDHQLLTDEVICALGEGEMLEPIKAAG
jgi:hypothetical protein